MPLFIREIDGTLFNRSRSFIIVTSAAARRGRFTGYVIIIMGELILQLVAGSSTKKSVTFLFLFILLMRKSWELF